MAGLALGVILAAAYTPPPLLAHLPTAAALLRQGGGVTITCCAAPPPPPREVDSRGFVIPQVGDVVKMPSKWPGEWDVGQVDFVQFIGARASYEVDLLPLAPIGDDLYRLPGKKPSTQTLDVAKLGRLAAEYVPERDAYRVPIGDLEPLGGRKPENPDVTAQGLAEYDELKATLLREAALLGAGGALASLALYGGDVAFAVGAGSLAGCTYIALLQKETDSVDDKASMGKLLGAIVAGRLGVPVVLFAVLSAKQVAANGGGPATLGILPKEQFAGAVAGFLAYKAPLLVRQVGTAIKELTGNEDAQAPLTAGALPTGSLGMAVRLAQSRIKSQRDEQQQLAAADAAAAGSASTGTPLVVLCGPSGVGKSTLIARLLEDAPDKFGFSVSCTTRAPRAGEVAGVDYTFLSDDQFDGMVARDEFVEWARVGGQRYGTSVAGVQAVSASDKVCLMDLDVQGVEALVRRDDLKPYCVWVAPPSLDELRTRLRLRGTEDSDEIERRIARATQEIEISLSADYFSKIILNDDLDDSYAALKQALDSSGFGASEQ